MPRRLGPRKWRPPLALVVGGTLAAVLLLPVFAVGYLKVAGNILGWGEATFLFVVMAVLATAVLGYLLWRLVLRPVYTLTGHARAVREGRADVAPPQRFGTSEFSELGKSVIEMGETLQSRAASLRAYADHVTHELKSPLTAIRGSAELLEGDLPDADRAALVETVRDAAARMQRLLDDLRLQAEVSESGGPGEAQLSEVASTIKTAGLSLELGRDGIVPLSPADLTIVLTQLAQNAAAHGASVLLVDWTGGILSLTDNGSGIADGNRDRIFDPFFTTRRDAGGTGMGLAIVSTLLKARGGQIALGETVQGTRFEVRF